MQSASFVFTLLALSLFCVHSFCVLSLGSAFCFILFQLIDDGSELQFLVNIVKYVACYIVRDAVTTCF